MIFKQKSNLSFPHFCLVEWKRPLLDRLGGVMVKASTSRAEDRGSILSLVIPKTFKNGILVAVPPAPGTMDTY